MWMADEPSAALQRALQLLGEGKAAEAESAVTKAAKEAKARHGSGSHPLTCAYADIARVHMRMGAYPKAAVEFQHASKSPMPPDAASRRDRLAILYGYAEALARLDRLDEAEKVLRQCVVFAKNLHGHSSAAAVASNAPLVGLLLKAGKTEEALKLAQEAYDALWALGDVLITAVVPVRAEALKASGRTENAFLDLTELPDELAARAVSATIARAPEGDPVRMRAVLADLLTFADMRFGDGHPITYDVLAAVAHHEQRQGDRGDAAVRRNAVRRTVWSFAVRRVPGGLLANLEIGFEPDGAIHLVPHLGREPAGEEAAHLESVLTQAVDEMYARSGA